ncbi:trehalose-phosphatase [Natronolimnobius sp. AArcel1]|uniref:trehalose-phosphatase n=1 Tax=Natronolimnobius sp. AArcel1 TaxID=1679093 RepID=UPI0013EDD505|nr:trehalose-phosphatase [Natronolimnobius sp. AArcel1]NGM71521.1 trehalose-phosphatase [Natronolimnobius sp. AArcel1]
MTGTHSVPTPLEEALPPIRSTLEDASRLLVCLDFDGTLAPIVPDPDAATATAANESAVATLANDARVTTAIVSGRALTDVRTRIDGPAIYAGNHGLEVARNDSVAIHPIARKRASTIDHVCATLETVLESIPHAQVENKRLTGTVHVRSVPEPMRADVARLTQSVVDRLGGDALSVSDGKRILEIGPSVPWGKGNAVELIEAACPPATVPIYIGDDVTDESAFQAVEPEGIGVRVGDKHPSAASYRVDSPSDVAALLEWLGSAGVSLLEDKSPPRQSPADEGVRKRPAAAPPFQHSLEPSSGE